MDERTGKNEKIKKVNVHVPLAIERLLVGIENVTQRFIFSEKDPPLLVIQDGNVDYVIHVK